MRKTADELNRLHAHKGITVGRSTVQDWAKKHGAKAEAARCAHRHSIPEVEPANLRWGLDGTGKVDAQGKLHFILGIIDHGTRALLGLSVVERPSSWVILAHLFLAIDRFGKPECIRTDNGSVFQNAAFKAVLAAVGIHHEFTGIRCPWQNGRIERLFLTLKEKLNLIEPANGADLNRLLWEFRTWYNQVRPHQHLHGFTPSEVWRGINPYEVPPREIRCFEAWGGLLKGYYIRR